MNFNPESVLEELDEFEKKDQTISPVLEEYLEKVAKTGNPIFPWSKLKPLLKRKMDLVLTEFCKSSPADSIPSLPNTEAFDYDKLKKNIMEAVEVFQNAPFTIQRLCELVTNPRKHYNRTDKYMRGLEKNLLVVSTVEPTVVGSEQSQIRNQPAMVNGGIIGASDCPNNEHGYSNSSASPPPVNGTVLENFATVFPTATRIASPANNIQVSIVTGSSTYQDTEAISTFTYCSDGSGSTSYHEVPVSTSTYETNGATYCEPDTGEYIVVEQVESQNMACIVEEEVHSDSADASGDSNSSFSRVTSTSDESSGDGQHETAATANETCRDEPEPKRQKIGDADFTADTNSESSVSENKTDNQTDSAGNDSVQTCESDSPKINTSASYESRDCSESNIGNAVISDVECGEPKGKIEPE